MAESQTIFILRNKRDFAHVNATICMFEASAGRTQFPVYVDTLRLFRRGEIVALCKATLADEGPLTTHALSPHVKRGPRSALHAQMQAPDQWQAGSRR